MPLDVDTINRIVSEKIWADPNSKVWPDELPKFIAQLKEFKARADVLQKRREVQLVVSCLARHFQQVYAVELEEIKEIQDVYRSTGRDTEEVFDLQDAFMGYWLLEQLGWLEELDSMPEYDEIAPSYVKTDAPRLSRKERRIQKRQKRKEREARKAAEPTPAPSVPLRCKAKTKAGTRCKHNALAGSDFCSQHQK